MPNLLTPHRYHSIASSRPSLRALLFLGAIFCVLDEGQAAPKARDVAELNALALQDPSNPARIGARRFELTIETLPTWAEWTARLFFSRDEATLSVENLADFENFFQDPKYPPVIVEETRVVRQGGLSTTLSGFCFDLPGDGLVGPNHRFRMDDRSGGFYRWVLDVETTTGDSFRRVGALHAFVLPRRLVVVSVGDSYASGEGAPAPGAEPWVREFEGVPAHRSERSGFFRAPFDLRNRLQSEGYLLEFVNVTSSGAILHDVYSGLSQGARAHGKFPPEEVYSWRPQLDLVADFLTRTGHPAPDHMDALLVSGSGNDFGFAEILNRYLSPLPPFLGMWLSPIGWEVNWGNHKPHPLPLFLHDYQMGVRRELVQFGDYLSNLTVGKADRLPHPSLPKVRTRHVLLTQYPNLFKVPSAMYFSGGYWDVNFQWGWLPVPVNMNFTQLADANISLFPGLDTALRDGVALANARGAAGAQWHYIETDKFVRENFSVGGLTPHFARLSEATAVMPGPHAKTNAFHPNIRGHARFYERALSDKLEELFTEARLAQWAQEEGFAPVPGTPDVILGLQSPVYDDATRSLTVRLSLHNRGSAPAPAGTLILRLPEADLELGQMATPLVGPESAEQATLVVTLPGLPESVLLPFTHFRPGPDFVPTDYALRDRVLAHYFPRAYRFEVLFIPGGSPAAPPRKDTFVQAVAPVVSESERFGVIHGLLLSVGIPGHTSPETVTAADIDLRDNRVLTFFGFCDPAIAWQPTLAAPPTPKEILDFSRLLTTGDLQYADPLAGYDATCKRTDLRILFHPVRHVSPDKRDNRMSWWDATGLQPVDGFLDDTIESVRQSPLDGRSFRAEFLLERTGMEAHRIIVDGISPSIIPTLAAPPTNERLLGDTVGALVQNLSAAVVNYEVRMGTSPGGADLFRKGFNRNVENIKAPGGLPSGGSAITPLGVAAVQALSGGPLELQIQAVPQDGRPVFLALRAYHDDDETTEAIFAYQTAQRNARLREPAEGDFIDPREPVRFVWDPATDGADGYRLLIGSQPGGADLLGSHTALLGGYEWLSPEVTEVTVAGLPRDNRIFHVTLETLRGEWASAERHRFMALHPDAAGLLHPEMANDVLRPFWPLPLALPEPTTRFAARIYAGAGREGLLLDSGWLDTDRAAPLLFPAMAAHAWGLSRVWLHLDTDDAEDSVGLPLLPFAGSAISAPLPFGGGYLEDPVVAFEWINGPGVFANRLLVGSTFGANDIADSGWRPDSATQYAVNLTPFQATPLIHVTLLSQRMVDGEPSIEEIAYLYPKATGYGYDQSGDHLDDEWQIAYFGPNNPASAPWVDASGDGHTNATAATLGLHPFRRNEPVTFRAELVDGMLLARVPTLLTRNRYQFEWSVDLSAGSWLPLGDAYRPAFNRSEATLELAVALPPVPENRFYRLAIYPDMP